MPAGPMITVSWIQYLVASSMDSRSLLSDADNHSTSELLAAKNEEEWSAFGIIHHSCPVHENYITEH
jgi:hypothetical protein